MYYPYLRGRQFELIALRELVSEDLIGDKVIPVVEPVKLSSTLLKTLEVFKDKQKKICVIVNPAVGSFMDEMDLLSNTKSKEKLLSILGNENFLKTVIMKEDANINIEFWEERGINKSDFYVVNIDRNYLENYKDIFSETKPKSTFINDESSFRRTVRRNRILIGDRFKKADRNADYNENYGEFFSEDHLFFEDENYLGFADYSIIGSDFIESGFAAYAVAIHIVYFNENRELYIRHFVSDSNDDIQNPAKKFFEAVSKLNGWMNSSDVRKTRGLQELINHQSNETYPGLGSVKKLSLMHHLELMSNYLDGEI